MKRIVEVAICFHKIGLVHVCEYLHIVGDVAGVSICVTYLVWWSGVVRDDMAVVLLGWGLYFDNGYPFDVTPSFGECSIVVTA